MAQVTIKEMLDAGVHFGHQTQRWNPKMKPFVFGAKGGIFIIDLQKSVIAAQRAAEFVKKAAADGSRMIFVGTKKQAVEAIQNAAKDTGQFYITKRWLGGTLTNFQTIKESIDRLRKIDIMKEKGEFDFFSKKERSRMEKEYEKLNEYLEGIREMKEAPQIMFVVDLKKEHIAVKEAKRLGIPVVGIADTNVDPTTVDFPIPGNDDAIRSIRLFTNLVAKSFKEGAEEYQQKLRTMTDKESDVEQEQKQVQTSKPQTEDSGGLPVVKMAKKKLVAAGTADEVEIDLEIEREQQERELERDSEDWSKDESGKKDEDKK